MNFALELANDQEATRLACGRKGSRGEHTTSEAVTPAGKDTSNAIEGSRCALYVKIRDYNAVVFHLRFGGHTYRPGRLLPKLHDQMRI